MIEEIYLDLDDTLNSLTMYLLGEVFGLDVLPYDYSLFPSELGYEIIGAYDQLKKLQPDYDPENFPERYPDYDVAGFWKQVPRSAWAGAPQSPQWAELIYRSEQLVGQDNICILTTPTKDPECLAGKLEWIHNFLPPWLHRQYLMGPRKAFCAGPRRLLIDDSDHQVDAFRAKGGHAILVPRPWNTNHHLNTNEHLANCFRHYEAKAKRIKARIAHTVKPLIRNAA